MNSRLHSFRNLVGVFCMAALLLVPLACNSDQPQYVHKFKDRASVPGMFTDSVTMLISDSGVIRYRVISEVWKIYDKSVDPYWYYPKKVYFEKFNDSLKTESMVSSDTARYYTRRKLWELRKNVKIINLKGDKFETSLLYWDQYSRRIYSDSFIRIEQGDQTMMGYGFESNEQLTIYKIKRPMGDFPVDPETSE
ncbi:MAG TPA: LPS export ABC transporter periplasmic protein LptC [Bacteroidales bacterium]|nr:LPS export ABC transporter periplasmic protein LptC [Bacteroidales bacterium]